MGGRRLLAVPFVVLSAFLLGGNSPGGSGDATVRELLSLPSSAPLNRLAEVSSPDPNNLSPEQLLGQWDNHMVRPGDPPPSRDLQWRLLEAAEASPRRLPGVLQFLPEETEAYDRVKRIHDRALSEPFADQRWREKVSEWLMLRSQYFREDLIRKAAGAHDRDGWVDDEAALRAFARLDPSTAHRILESHSARNQPRTATLALGLRYEMARAPGDDGAARPLRAELIKIVEDRTACGYCRDQAADFLLSSDWPGRDDWYLGLLKDPTLRELHDGVFLLTPLATPVEKNPARWIPRMAALMADPDRTVHDAAVSLLIRFHLDNARRDALEPLLPWLSNASWSSARDRLRLIQSVYRLNMTAAIPGLIRVVERDSGYERAYAAAALGEFKATEGVGAMRLALQQESYAHHRRLIIRGLLSCEGFSPNEMAEAVAAYARQTSTEQGERILSMSEYASSEQKTPPVEIYVGEMIARRGPNDPGALVGLLLRRRDELASKSPEAAEKLREIIDGWSSVVLDQRFIDELGSGSASAASIVAALNRREQLRVNVGGLLGGLLKKGGIGAGVAAVLLGDAEQEENLLGNGDRLARAALLAGGRLVRDPLSVERVAELMEGRDPLLAQSAELFLISDDSPQARERVLGHHRGEALILGARQSFDPGHSSYVELDRWETRLREEVLRPEGPTEIIALLSSGYWGGSGQRIIRVYDKGPMFSVVADQAHHFERPVAAEELSRIRSFVAKQRFEDHGPLDHLVADGIQYEYLRLSRHGGRRVFMNNPDVAGGSVYDLLTRLFLELEGAGPLSTRYRIVDEVPGAGLLLRASDGPVEGLCGTENDVLVLVGGEEGKMPIWRVWTNTGLGPEASDTSRCARASPISEDDESDLDLNPIRNAWQLADKGLHVYVGDRGIWAGRGAGRPKKVIGGWFGSVIAEPDGRWVVASRTVQGKAWDVPNPIVRVDLENGKEYEINLPPADNLNPVAYVESHRKVLVERYRDRDDDMSGKSAGPERKEYYLVDPTSGESARATGEFLPLTEVRTRPPQLSKDTHMIWAAAPDYDAYATDIGLYDENSFTFRLVTRFPDIVFKSDNSWIDSTGDRVYVVFDGDLLRLPLKSR